MSLSTDSSNRRIQLSLLNRVAHGENIRFPSSRASTLDNPYLASHQIKPMAFWVLFRLRLTDRGAWLQNRQKRRGELHPRRRIGAYHKGVKHSRTRSEYVETSTLNLGRSASGVRGMQGLGGSLSTTNREMRFRTICEANCHTLCKSIVHVISKLSYNLSRHCTLPGSDIS